jgi:hypothetical protein
MKKIMAVENNLDTKIGLFQIKFSSSAKEMQGELLKYSNFGQSIGMVYRQANPNEKKYLETYCRYFKTGKPMNEKLIRGISHIGGKYIFSKICVKYMPQIEPPSVKDSRENLCVAYAFKRLEINLKQSPIDLTLIEVDKLMKESYQFVPIKKLAEGAFVVYFSKNIATHIGVIESGEIISKMGWSGVYKHSIDKVFPEYGDKYRIYQRIVDR